jgi:ADP-heptose:LPS heptosyltransferase
VIVLSPRQRGWRGLLADLRLARRLARQRFDLAVDFHGGPRASLLAWLSGAQLRVGYSVAGRGWMYHRRVRRAPGLNPRHSVVNQWDLLAALDFPPPDAAVDAVEMALEPTADRAVARRIAEAGLVPSDRLIVMHVSAGNPFRRWPSTAFAEVAAALAASDARHRIVLTAGPSDLNAVQELVKTARARLPDALAGRVLDCGEFSLAELRALAGRAALYIGGDSGPLHIAATTGVPIVGLYGPTLPARSAPWRAASRHIPVEVMGLPCRPCDQRVCAPGDFRCLSGITPARVIEAAREALTEQAGKMSAASR